MKWKVPGMKIKAGCMIFLFTAVLGAFSLRDATVIQAAETAVTEAVTLDKEDGEYSVGADLFGGSGKSAVSSPALMIVKDGKAYVQLEWSSSNYDYMIVGDTKYLPLNEEGNSVFEIPILAFDEEMTAIADTTAMGTPHEITYSLIFYSESIGSKGQIPRVAAKRVLGVAFLIIVVGGILNHFVKKRREESYD